MKKHFYPLAMVFVLTILNSTSAKADGLLGGLLGDGSSSPSNCQPATLPIDNQVVALVIVAVIIGFFAIRKAGLGSEPSTKS